LGNKAQAADEDITIKELYISEAVQYEELWYLAMTVDRENYLPSIVVSKTGQGRDIQTIAKQNPESIMTFNFKLTEGIPDELVERIAAELELQANDSANLATVLRSLHKIFIEKDAMLLEIGSLGRTKDGKLVCLDSNFTFDDDASNRQPDLFALRDKGQEVTDEVEAEKYGLVYVRMDGDIGNVVNGAGLAMATNDAVCLHGGQSANFLDAGGQATTETMMQAFGIILRDKRVKSILVNIYGGKRSSPLFSKDTR
jgi:succinyl-CoA synthetase beta subunit